MLSNHIERTTERVTIPDDSYERKICTVLEACFWPMAGAVSLTEYTNSLVELEVARKRTCKHQAYPCLSF